MLKVEVFDNAFYDFIDVSQDMQFIGDIGAFVEA
jgi:hypothetical protein